MRILMKVILGVVVLAGCRDFGGATIPSGPSTLPRSVLPGADLGRAGDYWLTLTPSERRAAVRTIEEVSAEQGAVYLRGTVVLLDGSLSNGVQVIVMRDPDAPAQPMLVVSRGRFNDRALASGITAYSAYFERGESSRARALTVTTDDEVFDDTGKRSRIEVRGTNAVSEGLAARFISRATSVSRVSLPGLGTGTLLRFD